MRNTVSKKKKNHKSILNNLHLGMDFGCQTQKIKLY